MADAGQDLQQLIQNYHECRATLVNHDTEQAQAKATWEEAKTLLASAALKIAVRNPQYFGNLAWWCEPINIRAIVLINWLS